MKCRRRGATLNVWAVCDLVGELPPLIAQAVVERRLTVSLAGLATYVLVKRADGRTQMAGFHDFVVQTEFGGFLAVPADVFAREYIWWP